MRKTNEVILQEELNTFDLTSSVSSDAYILIADDQDFNHQVYSQQLRSLGIPIRKFYNGREVIEFIEKCIVDGTKLPSLIIMDFSMPLMNGIEATREIKKMLGSKIPAIVGVTAYNEADTWQNAKEAGMKDILLKPYPQQRLLEKVMGLIA